MRWFNNKKNNVKNTLIPYRLHAITEDVFDEIVERVDGYYLIKRCGEKPFTLGHGEKVYISDGETLIYALPKEQIQEIKLDWIPPNTFGLQDFLGFKTLNEPIISAKAKVDRRFEFKREYYRGDNDIYIPIENLNPVRDIFLTEIVYRSVIPSKSMVIERKNTEQTLEQIIIDLPVELKEGDLLKLNKSNDMYYILKDKEIINTDIEVISLERCSRFWCSEEFEISVPLKTLRVLDTPRNFNVVIDNDMCMITWEHVLGAERYEVYLNDKLIEVTEYNGYSSTEEYEGYMYVRAINDFTQSEFTESTYVKSLPNETFISFIDNDYEKGNHIIKVNFADYSEMESHYRIRWSVDGRQEQYQDIEGKPGIGSLYTHILKIPTITDQISIRVTSINDIGENAIIPPTILKIGKNPRWTYNEASKTMLIEWTHTVEEADRYRVKYVIDGQQTGSYDVVVETALQGSMKYYLDLEPNSQAVVSIAPVVDGKLHIYTVPVTVSMALDTTLIAPTLRTRKISETNYEFSWEDIYNCEKEFEVIYSISGSTPKKEIITSQSIATTGRRYHFNYEFPKHGYISVKVRMNWELGSSRYSEESVVYYVPASGLPPAYIRRDRTENTVRFEWEGQEYVKSYEIYKRIGHVSEIITVSDNNYSFALDYSAKELQEPLTVSERNRWKIQLYPKDKYIGMPDKSWIEGLTPTATKYVADNALSLSLNFADEYIGHGYTYIFVDNDIDIPIIAVTDDEGCVYLNNKKIINKTSSSLTLATNKGVLNLKTGWNLLEVIYAESTGSDGFKFDITLSQHEGIKTLTYSDRFVKNRRDSVEVKVKTNFLNGIVSEYSKPMIFTPEASLFNTKTTIRTETRCDNEIYTVNLEKDTVEVYELVTKSSTLAKTDYKLDTRISTPYTLAQFPYFMQFSGKALRTECIYTGKIVLANHKQAADPIQMLSIADASINIPIGTYIYTKYSLSQYIYTEVNKVRIITIGDSITAGHPGHWAETMTGNEKSQYQYWLNRRLKNQFEIINKGYGSDTTDRMLARFNKDVLGYNASYCIIQGGTNDLYWAMAEADGNQAALDMKVQVMKDNIREMVKRCWDNDIYPIVGTLIPRTGAVGIYKEALYNFNEWIIMFCSTNENIDYIDFFNAGKEAYPPTPLEDPTNPGALNPIYDGDAIYDEFGNLIKQGRGIHPSVEGYKIMGECIPLSLFRTSEDGFKLYVDERCTVEEKFNDQDKLRPFYELSVDNIRRGNTKHIVRYLKNVGTSQALFAIFATNEHSVNVSFLDEKGNKMQYFNGLLVPGRSVAVKIEFNVLNDDSKSLVDLHIASRRLTIN